MQMNSKKEGGLMEKMKFTFPYEDHLYDNYTIPDSEQPDIEPYAGGTRFEYPFAPEQQPLQELGLLDVTKPPFLADASGEKDCTDTLNEAIRTAQRYHYVCYFPLGTYRISDTLQAQQYIWWKNYPYDKYRVVQRRYPVVLMGERGRTEDGKTLRPTIYLAPYSDGFTFRDHHKAVIHVYNGAAPEENAAPASIENMITGLHIEIGEGNKGAVGVAFYAAQGCSMEDCELDVGDGYCGLWGAAGNGGSHAQNIIRGGRVGVDLSRGTPGAVMSGFVFDHQREHAIIAGTKQAVDFVGCAIYTSSQLPPVVSFGGTYELFHQGQISLIDCIIEFDAPMKQGRIQAAVSSRESIYLRNIYVRNATHFVWNPDGSNLAALSENWCRAEEFAHGITSMPHEGRVYPSPIYMDGKKLGENTWSMGVEIVKPPAGLLKKHRYFLPLWQDVTSYNVKDYGAKGDGITDDTKALQNAINQNEYVFLPKGYYRITDTLHLKKDTKLIGVAQGLSQILVTQIPDGVFAEKKENVPAIDTPDIADASVILAYCGLVTSRKQPGIYALRWRVAGGSILRNFAFYADVGYRITWITENRSHPWILVTGNGGGRWYNFWCDITQGGKDYRILSIRGTRQPFAIYACNVEHSRADYEMDILNCRNIVIYNLKSECNSPDLLIRNSDNIAVFSQGGDASTYPGGSLYHIENCTNFTLSLLYDYRINCSGHGPEYFSGTWFDPCEWHMLTETAPNGDVITTLPCERPCLYKRGNYRGCNEAEE